ncbi:MAG: siderophore-interacting protein [Mesorhizobium sp.]
MSRVERDFKASTEIALSAPEKVLSRLCAHFREFGEVTGQGRCRRIETGFGTADIEALDTCLRVCAAGKDEVALAFVKLALAENLLTFADESPQIVWHGDGAEGAPLPYFREMRVERVANITPNMRRVTFSGDNLVRFATGGLHVRLLIPRDAANKPVWPVMGADGRPKWPCGEDQHDVRIYTLRRVDAEQSEVDIDFVMHEGADMPGANFAANALPGDVVGMTGPGGGCVPDADWCLLAGDETALPAIARILEELPASSRAVVRIEVQNEAEIQPLRSNAQIDVQWLFRDHALPMSLPVALMAVDWPLGNGSVFAWVGCEYRDFLRVRRYLRNERHLKREEHLAVAYWRRI